MMTETERENLMWAIPRIQECETLTDAVKIFHTIKEREIKDESVGMMLLKRCEELGLESYSFGYADIEEYFGMKTVWDWYFERQGKPECVSNYRGRKSQGSD